MPDAPALLRDAATTMERLTRALAALVRVRGEFDTTGDLARLVAEGRRLAPALAAEARRQQGKAQAKA